MNTKSLLSLSLLLSLFLLATTCIASVPSRIIPSATISTSSNNGRPALDDNLSNEGFVAAEKPQSDQCDCYAVSGPDRGYFQHYRFWDFRKFPLHLYSDTSGQDDDEGNDIITTAASTSPSINIRDERRDKDENEDDKDKDTILLSQTPFATDWKAQDWHRPSSSQSHHCHQHYHNPHVSMVNSDRNVFIAATDHQLKAPQDSESEDPTSSHSTYLALRVKRFENYTLSAEVESNIRNVYHCSVRVRTRILSSDEVGSPDSGNTSTTTSTTAATTTTSSCSRNSNQPPSGACAGIFTYHPNDTIESDIEILTSDEPHKIHYANQPDYDPITDDMIPGASSIIDLPTPWTSWTTHRLDWFPNITRWFSDGIPRDENTYRVPDKPSAVVINLWSDGGNWTGDMGVGESVVMGVEWIEMVYNVSSSGHEGIKGNRDYYYQDDSFYSPLDKERCTRVCLVDYPCHQFINTSHS